VRPLVGEIVSTESDWPSLISVADSDRLRALLTRPERRITTGGARKHLLSGILHCARCGRPMVGRSSRGVLRYVCNRNPDGGKGACGRMFITAAPTDEVITTALLKTLNDPEMVRLLLHRGDDTDALYTQIRADEDELTWIANEKGHGRISRAEWSALRAPVVARSEAARRQLAETTTAQCGAVESFIGSVEDMRGRWEAMNVSQRRAVVTALLEMVRVHPATGRGNRFDATRLEPVWAA
jgi:hypothetical protein